MRKSFLVSALLITTANLAYAQNDFIDNVYAITERFITPKSQKTVWKWSKLANLPLVIANNEKPFDNSQQYSLMQEFSDGKSITGYGSKSEIDYISFLSSKNNGQKIWQLSQIVNPKNVKIIKSNCNLRDVSIQQGKAETEGSSLEYLNYQTIYQWHRKGSNPLYIAEISAEGHIITSTFQSYDSKIYIIAPTLDKLAKADLWNKNHHGKVIKCHFEV